MPIRGFDMTTEPFAPKANRAGDNAAVVRRLRKDLEERFESQQKLPVKYLNDDPGSCPTSSR